MTEPTITRERAPRWRRITGVTLIVLGAIFAPVAVVTNLAVTELTDTDAFVATFAPLANDPELQSLVTTAISDAIIEQADIPALTEPAFDSLALSLGPVASAGVGALGDVVTVAIQNVVKASVERFVTSDAFATVWETTLRVSHTQLISALSGEGGAVVSTQDGTVGIQLGPMVDAAKDALVDEGLGFAAQIPTVDRTIVVVKSDALAQAQFAYALAVGIAGWLPWIALLLVVAGVLVTGGSVLTIVFSASGVALAMVLLLIGLALGRAVVIREIVAADLPRGVAEGVFNQVFGRMYTTAVTVLVIALLVAVAIWLAQRFELVRRLRERFQAGT